MRCSCSWLNASAGSGRGQPDDGPALLGGVGLGRNTPFKSGKQVGSHLGGARHPVVVHRPQRVIDPGVLRSHFTHVIDIAPTILDIAGVPAPTHVDGVAQQPLHGVTFADSLLDAAAPERHTQQYFETIGNRAMYKDGWWLAMRTPR